MSVRDGQSPGEACECGHARSLHLRERLSCFGIEGDCSCVEFASAVAAPESGRAHADVIRERLQQGERDSQLLDARDFSFTPWRTAYQSLDALLAERVVIEQARDKWEARARNRQDDLRDMARYRDTAEADLARAVEARDEWEHRLAQLNSEMATATDAAEAERDRAVQALSEAVKALDWISVFPRALDASVREKARVALAAVGGAHPEDA